MCMPIGSPELCNRFLQRDGRYILTMININVWLLCKDKSLMFVMLKDENIESVATEGKIDTQKVNSNELYYFVLLPNKSAFYNKLSGYYPAQWGHDWVNAYDYNLYSSLKRHVLQFREETTHSMKDNHPSLRHHIKLTQNNAKYRNWHHHNAGSYGHLYVQWEIINRVPFDDINKSWKFRCCNDMSKVWIEDVIMKA